MFSFKKRNKKENHFQEVIHLKWNKRAIGGVGVMKGIEEGKEKSKNDVIIF